MIYVNNDGQLREFTYTQGRAAHLLTTGKLHECVIVVCEYMQWAPAHEVRAALAESGILRMLTEVSWGSQSYNLDNLAKLLNTIEKFVPHWTRTFKYVLVPGQMAAQELADRFKVPIINCAVTDARRGFSSYGNRIVLRPQANNVYNILESK